MVAFLADWRKVSSIACVRKPTLPSFKSERAEGLCGLAHVSAIQPVTLNPESPVTFRNRCDVENCCDDRRREVAKFTASCWVTLSAKNFRSRPEAVDSSRRQTAPDRTNGVTSPPQNQPQKPAISGTSTVRAARTVLNTAAPFIPRRHTHRIE